MYLSDIFSSFICGEPSFDSQVRYLAKRSIVDTDGRDAGGQPNRGCQTASAGVYCSWRLYAGGTSQHRQRQQCCLPKRHQRP